MKRLLEEKLKDKLAQYPIILKILEIDGVVLAGGAIRDLLNSVEPKDFDIFFTNDSSRFQVEELLGTPEAETHYTKTYFFMEPELDKPKLPPYLVQVNKTEVEIQLVFKQTYGNEQSIIDNFDFSLVQWALSRNGLFFGETTFQDTVDKKVSIGIITKPLSSLNRLIKYAQDYDIKGAYDYVLLVMQNADPKIVLRGDFYNGDE